MKRIAAGVRQGRQALGERRPAVDETTLPAEFVIHVLLLFSRREEEKLADFPSSLSLSLSSLLSLSLSPFNGAQI